MVGWAKYVDPKATGAEPGSDSDEEGDEEGDELDDDNDNDIVYYYCKISDEPAKMFGKHASEVTVDWLDDSLSNEHKKLARHVPVCDFCVQRCE